MCHIFFMTVRDFHSSLSSAHSFLYFLSLWISISSLASTPHPHLIFSFGFPSLYLTLSLLPLFSLPLLWLSLSPPSLRSLQHPAKSPLTISPSVCMYRSQCARPCSGECLCEWPCECACATFTRQEVVKEKERENKRERRRGGGGLDMAMWMMFWHWDCSWPTGVRVWRGVCPCVCVWDGIRSGQKTSSREKGKKN